MTFGAGLPSVRAIQAADRLPHPGGLWGWATSRLVQPAPTLSRLGGLSGSSWATELFKTGPPARRLPTTSHTGLQLSRRPQVMDVMQRLVVDKGNSIVVIEQRLDVIRCADWLIDLGPEGGATVVARSWWPARQSGAEHPAATPAATSKRCWAQHPAGCLGDGLNPGVSCSPDGGGDRLNQGLWGRRWRHLEIHLAGPACLRQRQRANMRPVPIGGFITH